MKSKEYFQQYKFALSGNPNVGKSTVFNMITGLNQHTGNWIGKTVEITDGYFKYKGSEHSIVDLPGTYSLCAESEEEAVAAEYIDSGDYDCIIIVADSSSLKRNLQFTLQVLRKTSKAVLCLNMSDIAKKNDIRIDTDELTLRLGIPVVSVTARNKADIKRLVDLAIGVADGSRKTFSVNDIKALNDIENTEDFVKAVSVLSKEISQYCIEDNSCSKVSLADKLLTGKVSGSLSMALILFLLFWLTAYGANYPGALLSNLFSFLIDKFESILLSIQCPYVLVDLICNGMLTTGAWVVSVMLPPAAIFFPLFAVLENWGILPRIAFNFDGIFSGCGVSGKMSLTMLMGFGCNSCGVMGCRIISSPFERKAAIITNSFIPCNGRLPMLLTLSTVFFSSGNNSLTGSFIAALLLLGLLVLSVLITLLVCKIMSGISKNRSDNFVMEMPCFKKPDIFKTIAITFKDKVFAVLLRAVAVALPAGVVIWLIANIRISDVTLLRYITDFLEPAGNVFGVDGVILNSYIFGLPANEIVTPVMVMSYTEASSLIDYSGVGELGVLLRSNGWNQITALCTMILCLFHFPCSTTLISIYKETRSKFVTLLSFVIPLITGLILCGIINLISRIFF